LPDIGIFNRLLRRSKSLERITITEQGKLTTFVDSHDEHIKLLSVSLALENDMIALSNHYSSAPPK